MSISSKTRSRSAKLMGLTAIALAALSSAPVHAVTMTDLVVEVSFNKSDLQTEAGLSSVYAKLVDKVEATCTAERKTLSYTGESFAECKSDLLEQMVESAKIESLKTYHMVQTLNAQ